MSEQRKRFPPTEWMPHPEHPEWDAGQVIADLRARVAELEVNCTAFRRMKEEAYNNNAALIARVAELEAERNAIDAIATKLVNLVRQFADPNNAPLMVMGDAHMAKLVDDARTVLAKGRVA